MLRVGRKARPSPAAPGKSSSKPSKAARKAERRKRLREAAPQLPPTLRQRLEASFRKPTAAAPTAAAQNETAPTAAAQNETAPTAAAPNETAQTEAAQTETPQTEAAQTEAAAAARAEAIPVDVPQASPEAAVTVPDARPAAPQVQPAEAEVAADAQDEKQTADQGEKAAAEAAGEAEAEAPPKEEKKAPQSPREDPAFQRVIRRAKAVAAQQGHNNPAQQKAAEAQAAAEPPTNEVASKAAGAQVGKMAAQEPKPFDHEGFKQQLLAKIQEIAPQSVDDVDSFKASGQTAELKGAVSAKVDANKEVAQGPIQTAAEEPPSTDGVEAKPVTEQPPTEAGAEPPDLGAQAAAPKPKSDAEISMDDSAEEVDQKWRDADITEEKLQRANEPSFGTAIASRNQVMEQVEAAPLAIREHEAGVLAGARDEAQASAARGTGDMYGSRTEQFQQIQGEQDATRSADEVKRQEVSDKIQGIYDDTKTKVEERLAKLDEDVATAFDTGADAARSNFDNNVETREEAWRRAHPIASVAERLGWPTDLDHIFKAARNDYIAEMDRVIDRIATLVETGLTEAKQKIDDGRAEVASFVEGLDPSLREVGENAAAEIQSRFDTLESEVKEHEGQLIDSLAEKYVERLNAIDEEINKRREELRGWVGRAVDSAQAVLEVYEKIKALLARFGEIVDAILDDPGTFLNNLIAGIKAGLSQFVGNIVTHLKKGLMAWLFGALASAGIQIPESFDLKGIIKLVMQVMGLTYQNFRARAVKIIGEPIVAAMETAVEIFQIARTEGVAGLWRWIKDMLGNLKSMVMDGIIGWIKEKVIVAGIEWVIGLLNPAGALVKIAMAIVKIVDFFITRGAQIMALANAILNSLAAIVSGSIGAMAGAIENALARAIPVTIGFLASLLGLGGISDMIREQLAKAQQPVNKAMDWVIGKAVKLAKSIGGIFGKKKKEDDAPETEDPKHDAKVQAGLAAIDTEEQKHLEGGKISREDAEKVATSIKQKHSVFKKITVVDAQTRWDYSYVASKGTKTGEEKEEGDKQPANWKEAEKVRGKPVGVDLPEGYDYYERDDKQFIRRHVADDEKYQQLGVSADGKIVFGKGASERISKPGALSKAVGGEQKGYQFHHLIPDAVVRKHPLTLEAIKRGEPPYNLDAASNGIRLPANEETKKDHPDLPMHKGSHPKWNALASGALDASASILKGAHGSITSAPPKILTPTVKGVETQLRGTIRTWAKMA